jgi:hypothetical protein
MPPASGAGQTSVFVDLHAIGTPTVATVTFQLHFDNETGQRWNECVTHAQLTSPLSSSTLIPFSVDPGTFGLQTGLSTFQAELAPGSAMPQSPFDWSVICALFTTIEVDFANGTQATTTVTPTCPH